MVAAEIKPLSAKEAADLKLKLAEDLAAKLKKLKG